MHAKQMDFIDGAIKSNGIVRLNALIRQLHGECNMGHLRTILGPTWKDLNAKENLRRQMLAYIGTRIVKEDKVDLLDKLYKKYNEDTEWKGLASIPNLPTTEGYNILDMAEEAGSA